MHIKLPQKFEDRLTFWRRRLLPRTLFFRTMLLIFIPLIVVQIVSVVVFFDGSWGRMGRRLSENLVDDIQALVKLHEGGFPKTSLRQLARDSFQIDFKVYDMENVFDDKDVLPTDSIVVLYLKEALAKTFPSGEWFVVLNEKAASGSDLVVTIKKDGVVYRAACTKKKIFSSSIFMFVVWMVATSVLLFLVSVLFLRIQVRAISDLARTAENFGKGIDDDGFKPYGSSEVRLAGRAFLKMKQRILKQIMERTQMLAGISHDLRTPLTRMKLMVTMMENSQDKRDFLADIDEMEKMLNGYLAFVRGEKDEQASSFEMNGLVKNIVNRFKIGSAKVKFISSKEKIEIVAKEQSLRRAITNIVANACRYGKKVIVRIENGTRCVRIIVDDNGPGIPKDKREDVFRAFYRLEDSRNKETGGIGLGLAITRDIITAHGGKINLEDGPLGGLRVVIELPL